MRNSTDKVGTLKAADKNLNWKLQMWVCHLIWNAFSLCQFGSYSMYIFWHLNFPNCKLWIFIFVYLLTSYNSNLWPCSNYWLWQMTVIMLTLCQSCLGQPNFSQSIAWIILGFKITRYLFGCPPTKVRSGSLFWITVVDCGFNALHILW